MQFNLSLLYSTILTVLFPIITVTAGAGIFIADEHGPGLIEAGSSFDIEDPWSNQLSVTDIVGAAGSIGSAVFAHTEINLSASKTVADNPSTPMPEPATMFLLGTGLIAIAGIGRKKLIKKRA